MNHLEQMTWKERIQYAIDKGDDLTIGEWEWLKAKANKRSKFQLWSNVYARDWQAALEALERIED